MYAITGITGQVGGAVADSLLASGQAVRGVVRDASRAQAWEARGCEIAVSAMDDASALARAFRGATAVFILLPPTFDPRPGFPEALTFIDAIEAALRDARPEKVVYLSTIGAQASESNLLTQHGLAEARLRSVPMPITFLRPAWFIENAAWDVASVKAQGVLASFLQPLDKPVPMVATADVGRTAAECLQQEWTGVRIVELEGPSRIRPLDLADAFGRVLGKPVRTEAVVRAGWETLFRAQGMRHPLPRMRMLDGFNAGWIAFEGPTDDIVKGSVPLEGVLRDLISRSA